MVFSEWWDLEYFFLSSSHIPLLFTILYNDLVSLLKLEKIIMQFILIIGGSYIYTVATNTELADTEPSLQGETQD